MTNISWFVKSGDQYARAEEGLVSIDDKSLTFTRDGIKFQLVSDFSLQAFLHGDVLFMLQDKAGKLIPFVLPETLSQLDVLLVGNSEKAEFRPGLLKELIAQRTEKLKKRLSDFQDLIRFLLKQKAEKDLQSLDFIKDIQSFQETVYEEFLKILEQNIASVAETKGFLLAASKPPSAPEPSPQPNPLTMPVPAQPPSPTISPGPLSPPTPSPSAPSPSEVVPSPPTSPVQEKPTAQPTADVSASPSPVPSTTKNVNDQIRSLFQ